MCPQTTMCLKNFHTSIKSKISIIDFLITVSLVHFCIPRHIYVCFQPNLRFLVCNLQTLPKNRIGCWEYFKVQTIKHTKPPRIKNTMKPFPSTVVLKKIIIDFTRHSFLSFWKSVTSKCLHNQQCSLWPTKNRHSSSSWFSDSF